MAPSLKDLRICPLGLLLGERSELRERSPPVVGAPPWASVLTIRTARAASPPCRAPWRWLPSTRTRRVAQPPPRARSPAAHPPARHAVAENAGYTCHLPHSAFEELLLEHGCGKLQPVPNSATGA